MTNCVICEKHRNKANKEFVLYENENWIISHGPVESQILGYIYLEPKKHYENWSDFTDVELSEIGLLIKQVETALKKELPVERLYSVTISEAVKHIHFHLIPRLEGENVKGLPLIEQATQGLKKDYKSFSAENYHKFISRLFNSF